MSSNLEQSYTEIKKKRILSILPSNLELNSIASCKVFTSGTAGRKWLFSDLDGLLCFLLDYQNKTRFLTLFDSFSFEKLFQYELYVDFGKSFVKLSDDFRAFEVNNGFIGLQFDYESEANQFDIIIKKCEGNFLKSLFESKPFTKRNDSAEKMKSYAKILVETFSRGAGYDENYAEDGTEIIKARSFEILNNISYNKEKKQFEIGEISEELRKIFIATGVRKKDLKNNLDFAFQMFKQIILGVSDNKDLLYTDYFHKQYEPPEAGANRNDSVDSDDASTNHSASNASNDSQMQNRQALRGSVKPMANKTNLKDSIKPGTKPNANVNANGTSTGNVNSNNKGNSNASAKPLQTNAHSKENVTPTAKLTPSQINQNKINSSQPKQAQPFAQPKQVQPVNQPKPVQPVTQPRQSLPLPQALNQLKTKPFDFQPPKTTTQPVVQVKPDIPVIPVVNPPKQPAPIKQEPQQIKEPTPPPTQTSTIPPVPTNTSSSSIPTPPPFSIPTPPPFTPPTSSQIPSIPQPPTQSIPLPPQTNLNLSIPSIPQVPSFDLNMTMPNIPMPPPFSLDLSMANIPIVTDDNPQKSREEELGSIKLKKVSVEETTKAPSMYEQIKNIKLKAVTKKDNSQIITKNEKNFLQNSLAAAIQQRRKNLMKHQDENESEDEDW